MKIKDLKLLSLLVMLCGFTCLFTSCSDDDDDAASASELVGTWQAKSVTGYEIWEGEKETINETYDDEEADCITFNADGTFISWYYDNGKKYDETAGKWKLSGKQLTMTYYWDDEEDEVEVVTIESLTDSQLIATYHDKEEDYEYYSRTVFKRVK